MKQHISVISSGIPPCREGIEKSVLIDLSAALEVTLYSFSKFMRLQRLYKLDSRF